ncbi:MAG: DUF305 domain-containing protein [Jatrophihabitantaceae bacterium]
MTGTADVGAAPPAEAVAVSGPNRGGLATVLTCLIVVACVAAAVAIGHMWGASGSSSGSSISASSVDAGFARDMSTHHTQAVTMAGYERDNTSNPSLKVLAFDIETSQEFQLGQMQGWLDGWGLGRESSIPQMAWMGHSGRLEGDGLMPGMATPDQMSKLQTLHGAALDIDFLQLMIHHHQGGLPMAQYAADHAKSPYVRTLAHAVITAQSNEIVQMEQILRKLGASPLPPPTT